VRIKVIVRRFHARSSVAITAARLPAARATCHLAP
jgi:hypothetical protein